ncbi:MAG: Hsp70 family protein [Herpetosiphon sp.]
MLTRWVETYIFPFVNIGVNMRVGLDFGTTNSSAAVVKDGQLFLIPLEPGQPDPAVLRSAVFIGRDRSITLGRQAIDRYTEGNVGREIVYERVFLGMEQMTFADIGTVNQALYANVDANAPGRLFLSLKMALPDSSFTGTDVFGTRWTLEELLALMLKGIRDRIERSLQESITELVIGRPVHYGDARGDQIAIARMQTAARLADLPPIRFMAEPTAAALHYAVRCRQPANVLVFDFGGGTLDVTIMHVTPDGERRVLAIDGVPVGGDLLDSRIVMGKILHHFGDGARLGARRLPLPAFLLDQLNGWQSIVELHRPHSLQVIDEAIMTGDRKPELRALRSLVRQNRGLPLYEMVESSKRRLSDKSEVELSMTTGDIQFSEVLHRWDFERLIGPDARSIHACIDRALNSAGLSAHEVDAVVRTGGSSQIPRFVRLLTDLFGVEKVEEVDVFTSVASGLGLAAALSLH